MEGVSEGGVQLEDCVDDVHDGGAGADADVACLGGKVLFYCEAGGVAFGCFDGAEGRERGHRRGHSDVVVLVREEVRAEGVAVRWWWGAELAEGR